MARGRKTGGRRPGSLNKATLERALQAERAVVEAKASGRKLAKEMLDDYMHMFAATAAYFKKRRELAKFRDWAVLTVETAKALAPYQSPRYSAVMVGAAVVNEIKITGGMPDDFKAPEGLGLVPAGTIIEAEEGYAGPAGDGGM
jgi:hypothetical protein